MLTSRRPLIVIAAGLAVCAAGWWLLGTRAVPPPLPAAAPVAASATAEGQAASEPDVGEPAATTDPNPATPLVLWPRELELDGPGDGVQLVVSRRLADGSEDLTRACQFQVDPPGVLEVSDAGYARALRPGPVVVRAYHEGSEAAAELTVRDAELPISDFALDIVPILTKAGCNSGQCHGSAQGKGGFHLSLFGYNTEADYAAITRDLEGRRLDHFQPESSLLLLKPSMALPHGGRVRLRADSPEYERVRRWAVSGAPWRDESRGGLERIVVEPADTFLRSAPAEQQLSVIAHYADGRRRDVTRLSLFVSNDPATVAVNKHGQATMLRRGQADLVVRFANRVATVRLAAPYNDRADFDYASVPVRNFIDDRTLERLEHMRLPVSPRTSDAEFLRRIYFDLVGHMPDPSMREDGNVLEEFLASASTDPDKRDKLIERLLSHPDFVLLWALRFGDHLQISSASMRSAAGSYRVWLANQLRRDREGRSTPYDQMVRTLLLATGPLKPGNGQASYYAAPQEPGEIAEQVARRFLGIRIRCARCHDHPLDVWTQDDYFGFASFFGRVRVEADERRGQEVKVVADNAVRHLRTGEVPSPRLLGGGTAELPEGDVREPLVQWMLSDENPRFARMAANWVWAHLMGRGLVEPVDDLRETNQPVNPALLDELAAHLRETGYDLRALIRTICQSEAYQRSSAPLAGNEEDGQFFSHALLKPLTAQQLADAIAQVTGIEDRYTVDNTTIGKRALQVNDPGVGSYLLDVLGRCDRSGGCEVGSLARTASLKQALHLIIGDAVNNKLSRQGSAARQMAEAVQRVEGAERAEMVRHQIASVYVRAYCRPPTPDEAEFWGARLAESDDYTAGLEDMFWAVLNSREFVFNH